MYTVTHNMRSPQNKNNALIASTKHGTHFGYIIKTLRRFNYGYITGNSRQITGARR